MTETGTATAVSLMKATADDMQAKRDALWSEAEELREKSYEAEQDGDDLDREVRSLREAIAILERNGA